MLKAVVADDHPLFLKGLVRELEEFGVGVVAACADGRSAVEAVAQLSPHFAVLDVRMPGMGGVEACYQIRMVAPGCIVVMLSTFDEPATVRASLSAGARAFLPKDSAGAEIARTLARLHADPSLTLAPQAVLPPLTRREEEVFWLVMQGSTNPQIAHQLGISTDTAKDHVGALFHKFEVRDRLALLRRATELGYVIPPDQG